MPLCVFAQTAIDLERGALLQKYLLIAAGGALGSIARYFLGSTVSDRMGTRFPFGTLIVNLTACIIIGFSATYLARRVDLNPAWRYLIPVGFIGAFSTFSAYEWETFATLRTGAFIQGAIYAFGSLILGLVAVWFGSRLAGAV
jgi:CrcB protein